MPTGSPATRLLLRNPPALDGRRILVVDAPAGDIGPPLAALLPDADITLFQTRYSDFRRARASADYLPRVRLDFGAWYTAPDRLHDVAAVYLPHGREALALLLDMVRAAVAPGGRVLLTGPLRGGIRSARAALEERLGTAERLDAARHCLLFSATAPGPADPAPTLEERGVRFNATVGQQRLELHSFPGVFSHGRLDDGTRLLLETPLPTGRKSLLARRHGILDFGCGCGAIGAWFSRQWPDARVDMTDSNAVALEAARRTAALNGMPGDAVFASDVFSDVDRRYGLIVSNPPFHSGVDTDYRVVADFLRGAAGHLVANGTLRLVANRFLKYRPLLEERFAHHRVLAEDNRFRVYEAVR